MQATGLPPSALLRATAPRLMPTVGLLILLLFVAGVMNLLWVALIAGYVLVEKAIPAGQWVSRVIGLLTFGWGAWLLIQVLGT